MIAFRPEPIDCLYQIRYAKEIRLISISENLESFLVISETACAYLRDCIKWTALYYNRQYRRYTRTCDSDVAPAEILGVGGLDPLQNCWAYYDILNGLLHTGRF